MTRLLLACRRTETSFAVVLEKIKKLAMHFFCRADTLGQLGIEYILKGLVHLYKR